MRLAGAAGWQKEASRPSCASEKRKPTCHQPKRKTTDENDGEKGKRHKGIKAESEVTDGKGRGVAPGKWKLSKLNLVIRILKEDQGGLVEGDEATLSTDSVTFVSTATFTFASAVTVTCVSAVTSSVPRRQIFYRTMTFASTTATAPAAKASPVAIY
ncbi:hypothetical protein Tcan_15873 [Toxocara canis]|uniref:Uncharacterized protein n=1 Tax=Toxocara canis TaxID=6265 RepID=A0A0B2VTF0_TOXCA|nr:hypothetical protein Tcan_15873 [Toxocara canis]